MVPTILVTGILGVEALPALCRNNCEHHAKLPEHTHEEQRGGFSYDFPLNYQVASVAGDTTTATITKPLRYTVKLPDSTDLL